MNAALITSCFTVIGSLVAAAWTYWLTKKRDRDAEWRKEKLAYYKAFIESVNGIVKGNESSDGNILFAKTSNNMYLFAPQFVLDALNAYRDGTSISNPNLSQEKHDKLWCNLLLAIRRDIGVQPADNESSFKAILWASGVGKNSS